MTGTAGGTGSAGAGGGASATIDAPIDVVWNVLTEGEHYGRWPSGWAEVRGEFEDGARVTLTGPSGTLRVKVEFGVGDGPGRSMRWSSGLPGVGRKRHDFSLTEPDAHRTLLRVSGPGGGADGDRWQRFVDAVRDEAQRRASA